MRNMAEKTKPAQLTKYTAPVNEGPTQQPSAIQRTVQRPLVWRRTQRDCQPRSNICILFIF